MPQVLHKRYNSAGSPERKESSQIAGLWLKIWDLDRKSPTYDEEVSKLLHKNPEITQKMFDLYA